MDESPTAKRLETALECAPNDMDDEIRHRLDKMLDIVDDEPSSISTAVNLLNTVQMSEELGVLDPNFENATKPSREHT